MMISDLLLVGFRQTIRARRRYKAPLVGATLGIAALVIVYTLGDSIQKSVGSNLSLLGSATLIKLTLPLVSLDYPNDSRHFSDKDLADIENIPGVAVVSAAVYSWWPTRLDFKAIYREREYLNVRILGVDSNFFKLAAHMPIARGRAISYSDTQKFRNVCVIGNDVRLWLFPNNVSPLGESIIIDGIAFQIVGVLGIADDQTLDETVILPISVARSKINGLYSIRRITVLPDDLYSVEKVYSRISALLAGNKPTYKYSLYFDDERITAIKNVMHIFQLFVYAALITTLILSEIGVINVMLSMVRERTYEIGLRKALGATDGDIVAQFICESVLVSMVSSVIGILLGSAIVLTVAALTVDSPFDYRKYELAVIAAIIAGGLAGVISGALPARLAARLDPAIAMKAE